MNRGIVASMSVFMLLSGLTGAATPDEQYLLEKPALTIPAMLHLAPLPRAEFIARWQALYAIDLKRLKAARRAGATAEFIEHESMRLQFRRAQGRVMYPFFHWRESDAATIEFDPDVPRIAASLPVNDARWFDLPEARDYLDARIHELARVRLAKDASLHSGDARALRAELLVLDEILANPALRLRKATELIARHIEDDGAKNLDPVVGKWLAHAPPTEDVSRIRDAIAKDRAHDEGHRKATYRVVGGVPLELHILEPGRARATPRPAMLWLHGGSATEGTWWHSPGIVRDLLDQGVVVVAVEMTTGNRFDQDSDQNTDASEAFEYLKGHAGDFNINADRIGVAGFSSGAGVALLMATRGAAPAGVNIGLSPRFPRPAAVIVSGACADPLSATSDGYFRKSMARVGNPADFSPYAQIRMGLPPVLSIHATADEFCSHADMARFVARYQELNNEATLVSVADASHFFGFYHEPGKAQMRAAIAEAFGRWGW